MSGKIGIMAPENLGDICLATCALKYKDILWPGKKIIWFGHLSPEKAVYFDILKHNDAIDEIRDWPKFDTMEHFRDCIDSNGHFKPARLNDFESTKDLDQAYFAVAWAVLPNTKYDFTNYANIIRDIYQINPYWDWRPVLGFSKEERDTAKEFHSKLPYSKTCFIESNLRSAGNFHLPDESIEGIKAVCRAKWGACNFIFASKIDHTKYVDDPGVVSIGDFFTVRQAALVHDHCDLMIGVASGITQACSRWGGAPVPRVELCGTTIVSSIIANGPVNSIICDNWGRDRMITGLVKGVEETLNKL